MGFDNFAGSPSRRGSDDVGAVVQHQQPLPIPIESSDPLLLPRYPPPDQTTPPTLELPPAPYYYGNPTYDIPWMWPMDGPIQLFGGQDPPPTQGPAQNSHILPIPNPPAHQRPLCVDEVRQKSTALHKVQQYRVTKRKPAGPVFAYGREWPTLDKGKYECQWPGCKGKKRGFKRQEHLKRHENTVHLLLSHCRCPFCIAKPFNREDNFRTHVLLHTKKGGTSRTKYHPDAQAYLDMLNLKVKQRNHAEKRVRVEKRVARGRKAASRGITDHDHLSRLQTEAQYIMAPQDTMEPPPITV
ncbi:hypothetical protein F5B21DRAFT_495711 [Xylaria acuta]|nr:hypothetical protein F5B21DRAFT_495711 [Xylaria acuta]